jgi:hypothetical protein
MYGIGCAVGTRLLFQIQIQSGSVIFRHGSGNHGVIESRFGTRLAMGLQFVHSEQTSGMRHYRSKMWVSTRVRGYTNFANKSCTQVCAAALMFE